ncbi:Nn.00g028430.m01.CDS01 [Neocucurbitaria sp. VM-36]
MPGQRLIDRDERTRKKSMDILVLGMCRTGTTSVSVALRKLGYTPYQMREVLVKPKDMVLWQEAINVTLLPPQDRPAKQRNLLPYGKSEFDKLLGDYDAIMDLPGCVFATELIKAYPEAKVILTKRAYTDWEQSMQESIWCLDTWRLFTLCRILNITQLAPLMRLVHSVFRVHNGNTYGGPAAKTAYEKHYDAVRSSVPKDRLLELDTDSELSWEPLCNFLGTQVPKEPYPKLNEEKAMRKNLDNAWWGMVQYLVLMLLLPGLVTVGAVFCYLHADDLKVLRDEWIIAPLKSYLDG